MADLRVDDFSGGITENYVNGPLNRAKIMDNLLINKNKKPWSRYGSTLYDATYYQIPAGVQRIGKIKYFEDVLFEQSARSVYYRDSGWVQLRGPVDNNFAYGAGDTSNHVAMDTWQHQIFTTTDAYSTPRKIYHDGSDWQVRTAGMPALASTPTVAATGAPAGKSYIWHLHYFYSYTVGNVTYEDSGPTVQIQLTNAADPAVGGNTISSIPVISNGIIECYDTATIKVKIHRTSDGGTVGKYVGEVTNGTTTFLDTTTDASLGINVYTTGGVYDYAPPPQAKYVTIANDIAWYCNIKEGSEEKSFRIRQSIQYDPDSCPESFFIDVDDDITGASNVDVYPLVFTKNKTYRLEGTIDALGRGFIRKRVVSDTIGCVSNNSIVRLAYGVFFCSLDGFYFCDGYRVQKLSDHLNETYREFVVGDAQQKKISGVRDKNTGRIFWTIQTDSGGIECDAVYVLDPYWGLSNESSFTTWSAGDNMKPTALEFIEGELARADSRGYVFIHKDDLYADPEVDVAAASPADWFTRAVIYDYESCAIAFGTETQRKYITKLLTVAKNLSNLSVQPQSINDDTNIGVDLKEIRFRNNLSWGDGALVWGDPETIWNYSGVIIGSRRMPRRGLRCTYKQIKYSNAETIIAKSDDYGTATVDVSSRTAVLSVEDWPDDVLSYKMYFEFDDYATGFEIQTRTATTLTLFDPDMLLLDGVYKWEMKGFKIPERFQLEAYTVEYHMFGESQTHYRTGDDGSNA